MSDWPDIFQRITQDERYRKNLDWGEPRSGHPEGSIRAHVEELDRNLAALRSKLGDDEYWRLRILVHVHDTFKPESVEGIAIKDPRSHASLARQFLAGFTDDADLLNMTQFHDEPYALWRQAEHRGDFNRARFDALLATIKDWDVFLAFCIIDGCTAGKSRAPLRWLFRQVEGKVPSRFTAADIIIE
jgi:hypothetical protein